MDIVDRLSDLISASRLSVRSFAAMCGIKQQTLSNQINRTRELSLATISAILTSNEDISAEWLLRGRGEMKLGEQIDESKNIERINRLVDTIATLQDTINAKSETITILQERIKQLESIINPK